MAIDSLFFFDLLRGYAKIKKNGEPMGHLVHASCGVKLTKDAILRDVFMLENQIPLFVLRKIFSIICSKTELVDEVVNSMLIMSFCHDLTPLPVLDQNCSSQVVLKHAHLLDLMYHLILPDQQENYPELCEEKCNYHTNNVTHDQPSNTSSPSPSPCRNTNTDSDVAPVVVMIPSVIQLHAVGIKFRPASGGIGTIMFDEKTSMFYLPKSPYSSQGRAIVDTVEDVKVLMEKKIVVSSLDDDQVEKLFNGMSKSVGPTKTPNLDKTIAKVNKYYNGTQKVKRYRLMKKYVYSSWRICTLLATLLLLALIGLKSFCSVYDCPHIFMMGEETAKIST
ncbi:UPF0481 protein [Quillaja saponaria]|uniref:UPF0481 protein n=1 Tax=Quillaja saponaria TaxID=32244 RepID=A0AAD7P9G5_QUISA|nr:UPF0481 protein [Quillaja saponaria]